MTIVQPQQKIAILRDIASIDTSERLRAADPAKVAEIKDSFQRLGHQTPIDVWGAEDADSVKLGAGMHRLTAAKELGWTKILCFHHVSDDFARRLWEVDENLSRAALTKGDVAVFLVARKQVYLEMHPETAREASLRQGNSPSRQVGETGDGERAARFTAATALATGLSERSIQRGVQRGENIEAEALHLIRGTRLANSGAFLDRLAKVPRGMQVTYVRGELEQEKSKAADTKANRRAKAEVRHSVRLAHMGFVQKNGEAKAGQVTKKYSVIYADPPWQFGVRSEVTGREKGAENHYPTMPTDDICKLWGEIGVPAKADAVLFLWATNPMLPDALRVMEAWGFAYVHHWVWDKCTIGTGYWGRDQHELLLIGRRGNPAAPLPGTQPATVYSETKGPHSAKPVHFARLIEGLYPGIPKLEMFQRRASLTDGDIRLNGKWDFWGLEAGEAEAAPPVEPESAPVVSAAPETDERELYRQAMSILHEGGEWTVAVLQERLGLAWGPALRLYDRIEDEQKAAGQDAGKPETAPEAVASETDGVLAAILAAGLEANEFLLHLNSGLTNNRRCSLPSRLFEFPVEFIPAKRNGGKESRLVLRHPDLWAADDVVPFLEDIQARTGIRVEWADAGELGRDVSDRWRWLHAIDLCKDKHWQGLLATANFTCPDKIFRAVRINLQGKELSLKNARAIMQALDAVEPVGRSVEGLLGKGLWPYQDGKRKYIAPNIGLEGAASAWLAIHGIKDGWLAYVGGNLSVTAEGMERRERGRLADQQETLPIEATAGAA